MEPLSPIPCPSPATVTLQSQPLDLSIHKQEKPDATSQKIVIGSRKRKMNSHPMRILSPLDETDSGTRPQKAGVLCGKQRIMTADGSLATILSDTDIKLVDEQNSTGFPRVHSMTNSMPYMYAQHDGLEISTANCDKGQHELSESAHSGQHKKCLALSAARALLKNMSVMAREVKTLKTTLQTNGRDDARHSMCASCNCDSTSNFHYRLTNLETRFSAMESKIEKLYTTSVGNL